MQITQPDSGRKAKAFIYGPAGHGKTRLLGTANDDERTAPILVLDYEGGTSSLVGRDIDIVRIQTPKDYEEVKAFLVGSDHPYKSVALDSLSEAHVAALLGRLDGGRQRQDATLIEQADYGSALVQMRRLVRLFRDLPLHFFATSLAKEELDTREGFVKKPALSGAFAEEVLGLFESVGYLALGEDESKQVQRVLILNNVPKIRAKTRVPMGIDPPSMLVEPTIGKLLDALGIEVEA